MNTSSSNTTTQTQENIPAKDIYKPNIPIIFVKISLFFLIVGLYLVGFAFGYKQFIQKKEIKDTDILLQAPIKISNWQDIGRVSDPILDLPIKTKTGYKKISFLLDSGAVISSLPREIANEIGVDLAFLKRISFVGYGGHESFAYKDTVEVLLGETTIQLPVVFTESYGTRALLGRQGFFDEYVIIFNQKNKIVEVRK